MNMKKILAMPIMCVVVAMLGVAVMAASPSREYHVTLDYGTYEGREKFFHGDPITTTSFKVSDIPGIDAELAAKDKDLKASAFSYLVGYDVEPNAGYGATEGPYRVYVTADIGANDYAVIVHLDDDGNLDKYEIVKGAASEIYIGGINSFSPFLVFKATVKASAQTGEYAAPYIIMISVALVSCGAIFAIRAKKATK
ncbi:MAG: hypothetical protein IKF31_06380 [Clostridiales bacterium]|nr:hypothetical protein [Clostridiales bacterium]